MDFKLILSKLLSAFNEQNIRYALIGGMAMGVWGVPRGTVDIDFLVHREDIAKVDAIMKALGYELKFGTENVSQYVSPLQVFGEVDFLHAFRTHSLGMLQRAVEKKILDNTISVRVLKIEDLIGFKVQAIANNKDRMLSDLADIESLVGAFRHTIDWEQIKEYFELFNLNDMFAEIRRKYGNPE